MFVHSLVSLYLVTGLASSTSQAAAPTGSSRLEASGRLAQRVVLSESVSHERGLPCAGLISVGNPPSKLTSSLISVGNPGNPPKLHGKGLPPSGLISVGNPPSKLASGLISVGNPPSKLWGRWNPRPSGGGHARSATWIGVDGTELTLNFASNVDLEDIGALVVPAGEWVDLELDFDGELLLDGQVDGATYGLSLDVGTWAIPFETPIVSDGQAQVVIDLELPELLVDEVLAQDGLVVEPGDLLHDELVEAVQGAAVVRAR